jgi:hypothetical protein
MEEKVAHVLGLSETKSKKAKKAIHRIASKINENINDSDLEEAVAEAVETDSYFVKKTLRQAQQSIHSSSLHFESSSDEETEIPKITEHKLKSLKKRMVEFYAQRLEGELDSVFDDAIENFDKFSVPQAYIDRAKTAFTKETLRILSSDEWMSHFENAEIALQAASSAAISAIEASKNSSLQGGETKLDPTIIVKVGIEELRKIISEESRKALEALHLHITETADTHIQKLIQDREEIGDLLVKLSQKGL